MSGLNDYLSPSEKEDTSLTFLQLAQFLNGCRRVSIYQRHISNTVEFSGNFSPEISFGILP